VWDERAVHGHAGGGGRPRPGAQGQSRYRTVRSVADPGCLSRILIFTHPGSPKTATKERGEKIVVTPFYVATNFTKLHIILVLMC
jgi:hypothetical protein